MGAMPKHPWIETLMHFYDDIIYEDTPECFRKMNMTWVVADICTQKFNFKPVPMYQVLDTDVHVYPPDVFSIPTEAVFNVKYSTHWCENSWVKYGDDYNYSFIDRIKSFIVHKLLGEKRWRKIKYKLSYKK